MDELSQIKRMPQQGGTHEYLSTGCLHGEHGYCKGETGAVGAKRPAECKFCGARCICDCHAEVNAAMERV